MRIQLLMSIMLAVSLLGCQQQQPPPQVNLPIGSIEVGGFVEAWQAPLSLGGRNRLTRLFLREDTLFAYTEQNSVYAISASGGQVLWTHHLGRPGDRMLPPVLLEKNLAIIAGISTLQKVTAKGDSQDPIEIGHSIRSPLTGSGTIVYCGLDYPNGGRIAKIDVTKPYNNTIWEFLSRQGFSAAPVYSQGLIYAGGEDGNVYAVNESKEIVWPLPDGVFKTDGRILADLKADTAGVYVASTDSKLYCLDPNIGKIKWQYFASGPLVDSPRVTAETVYQHVPEGIVAIDKTAGDFIRQPKWIAGGAMDFLAEDAQYAYLRDANDSIIGVDRKTGELKFHNARTDLVAFASNPKGTMIYAATANGLVLGIKPVTKAGVVGQTVRVEVEEVPLAMAR